MNEINKNLYKNVNYCLKCGNKLILKNDREGKIRPICEKCGWIYYKNPIPTAACVIFNEKNELLLIKRRFLPNAGEWALPSGYMEIYQTPEETAIEEMAEETGLKGEIKKFIDYRSSYSPIYEKVISFGFLMNIIGGKLQAGDDASEARFYKINKLPEIAFKAHKYYIKKAIKMIGIDS